MTRTIEDQMAELAALRLPDLQARFAEIVRESTRSPNKRFLLRRIAEALEAQRDDGTTAHADEERGDESEAAPEEVDNTPVRDIAVDNNAEGVAEPEVKLSKLSVPELQERYRQTIGRQTRSTSSTYLAWKIRQAEKGRIRVGPVRRRDPEAAGDFKVLPLRMHADAVARLDEARVRLGLKSRMELIRKALCAYLAEAGENEVAALLNDTGTADA